MKQIRAFIKPQKLDDVMHALRHIDGLSGASAVHGHGFGRGRGQSDRHRREDELERLAPVAIVELLCNDELVDTILETILTEAHTGLRGDGKVVVSPIEDAQRIATGERGDVAL